MPTADLIDPTADHQVLTGDALQILPTLAAGSVDMIFTDPPYGHNNNNNGDLIQRIECAIPNRRSKHSEHKNTNTPEAARPIANDGAEANDLFRQVLPMLRRLMDSGCCCCCCGGGGPDPQFARWSLWLDEVFDFKQMVIWDKGPMGMGWHYRRSYETVLVAEVPGKCRWYDETSRIENIIRPDNRECAKIIPSATQHPTEKPVGLAKHFIRLHTKPGDLVLDPFCGTGSTGEAAKLLGRRFIGIELDPGYADIARRRIADAGFPLFEVAR